MVDINTWNALNQEEQKEFTRIFKENNIVQCAVNSGTKTGFEFVEVYHLEQQPDGYWVITDGKTIFADIRHESKNVVDALFTEVVQNYGK